MQGSWKNDPPPKIAPKSEFLFRSEAKAGISGTEAKVTYSIKGTKNTITLEWANPFVGNPKFVYTAPSTLSVDLQKREGNNFLVDFTINPPGQSSVKEPTTQADLEAAIQHCNTQLQSVSKIKEGLVVMMRSYEKANDDKSAKILGPQIAEKDLEINSLTEKKTRWEKKLKEVTDRIQFRRTIKPETLPSLRNSLIGSLMARVDFDYSKEEEGELSIRRGDIIVLLDNSDEQWWYGETNGSVGYFPASYVTILNTVQATQDDEIARRNSLTVSKESK
jgi:hypothetical protein